MTRVLPTVCIPATLLAITGQLLESFAAEHPAEGILYWFGLELDSQAVVTSLVVPDADTSDGDVVTSAAANAEALTAIVGTPLILIGQVHSHPRANVRHSVIDDRDTYAQFPGALSVVVPYFGRQGVHLERCGIHRHIGGGFQLIPPTQVREHLRVLPGISDFRRGRTGTGGSDAHAD